MRQVPAEMRASMFMTCRRTRTATVVRADGRHARPLAVRPAERAAGRRSQPGKPADQSVRSASRSIRSRRSSARCSQAHLPTSAAIRPTRAPSGFRSAVAAWLDRRYRPAARRSIPKPKCWCSTAPARACSSARIAAKRYVAAARRQAGDPGSQSVLRRLFGRRRRPPIASRSICRRRARPASCPTSTRSTTALLARTVAFYLASPANPQGAVADRDYLARLVALARRFGFLVFADECYSEIYLSEQAAAGMLEVAGPDFANVVVFHSLSKRSNLPGLRVGFAAGDRRFLARFLELRNVAAPQVPVPAQEVGDRRLRRRSACRREPRALRAEIRSRRPDHRRPLRLPAAGRRLLPLARRRAQGGSDEAARASSGARRACASCRATISRATRPTAAIPARDYIRVAMVQDKEITAEALHRLVAVLG